MFFTSKYIHLALFLVITLSSCTTNSQPTNDRPPSPTWTSFPTHASVPPTPTLTPVRVTFHLDKSALSYGVFETEATSLTIEVSNTVPGQFKEFTDISVEDGAGLTTYEVEAGESTIVHSLPAGKKRVTVTSGLQTKFRNKITGVFINEIVFNGPAVPVQPAGKRILVYGDSLTVGGNVDRLSAEAWPVLLRKRFAVTLEAYGYRSLHDDALTAEARFQLAAQLLSGKPDSIWLAIGPNDYAFALWSARQFGEAYAAMLDIIHSANPQVILYAQTPIRRLDESPNSFGDTLEKYRQQIASACRARLPWCMFVDGTSSAFPQPDELNEDGIHLTTKSSAKYAAAVLDIIDK